MTKLTTDRFISIAGCYGDIQKVDYGYVCTVHLSKTFSWKLKYDLKRLTVVAVVDNGYEDESSSLVVDYDITEEKLS